MPLRLIRAGAAGVALALAAWATVVLVGPRNPATLPPLSEPGSDRLSDPAIARSAVPVERLTSRPWPKANAGRSSPRPAADVPRTRPPEPARIEPRRLLTILESDAPWPDRYGAAQALAQDGDPELVAALIAALRRERDPAALDTLTRTLQAVQDAKAAPALLEAVASPSKDRLRLGEAIRDALARVADAEAVVQMAAMGRADALPEPQRLGVLAALARVQNPAAIPALAGLLESDTDPRLAAAAASALGRMGDEPAIAALVKAIDRKPDIAADDPLVISLAGVDNKDSCARLIGVFMAATNHPVLRHAAALALARAGEAGRAYGIGEQDATARE